MAIFQWSGSAADNNIGNPGNWLNLQTSQPGEPGEADTAIIGYGQDLTGELGVDDLIIATDRSTIVSIKGQNAIVGAENVEIAGHFAMESRAFMVATTAEVEGGGSTMLVNHGAYLNVGSLVVGGSSGTSSMTVTSGGQVAGASNPLSIELGDARGSVATMTISNGAGVSNEVAMDLTIGAAAGATGILDVTGIGSALVTGQGGFTEIGDIGHFGPGGHAQGTLAVSNGGYVSLGSAGTFVGSHTGTATIAVSGAGSDLQTAGGVAVFYSGAISVASGGEFDAFGGVSMGLRATLTVAGDGSQFIAQALECVGHTEVDGGSVQVNNLLNTGEIQLTAGSVDVHTGITNYSRGVIAGAGEIKAAGILNNGLIDALGGTLQVTGNIFSAYASGAGALHIEAGAVLQLDSAVAARETVTFETCPATLALADAQDMSAQILDFASGSAIDLLGLSATGLTYAGGAITLTNGATTLATLEIAGTYTSANFQLAADGQGGSLITYAATAESRDPHPVGAASGWFDAAEPTAHLMR